MRFLMITARITTLAIGLLTTSPALANTTLSAASNPLLSTVQYSAEVSYNSKQWQGSGKVYHAAPNLERRELAIMGQNSVMLLRKQEVLMLMPQMNLALRMTAVDDPITLATQKTDSGKVTFTKLGRELVNGEQSDKYKVAGEAEGIFWVTPDGILVKAELPQGGEVIRYDARNIKRGTQPQSLFDVPAGTKVMNAQDMGAMMRSMHGQN
ncbi:hypothetical protein [Govanella unica]|uniref:DUF4412 domain-containing protein n=1 Tax=Govanella unica TaxID=2975056 RepID=A0A9X3TYK5_9PROT|nr:hypothetical protein [Govania unica]MDA5193914.1 DUF4412 domain-containing protein [Govania unica]